MSLLVSPSFVTATTVAVSWRSVTRMKAMSPRLPSLTERPTQQGLSWYQRPVVLAVVVLAATALLNIVFR